MILTPSQIKDIILNNPNANIVSCGKECNKNLRLHVYGDGLKDAMCKIEGYEANDLQALRTKYARSNKDLISRLSRPIDKVFSARGGSVYYNLPDTLDARARNYSLDVRNGFSVKKWVEMFWKPHMIDDPYGVIFLEILPAQEAIKAKQQGRSFVYPTYKSITSIYDYSPKGSQIDYVVFEVSADEKKANGYKQGDSIYRVVDDAMDYWIKKENESITILPNSYPNYFGFVPGIINTDLVSPEKEDCYLSLFDDIIELATHFLLKGSIKLTHEFLHAYPKYWQYATACRACGGTKYVNGEVCKSCHGSGLQIMEKVSDAMLLTLPDKEDQKITPDVAGYVSPDKTYYEIATADLQLLEELMNVTLWGAGSKVKPQGLTTNKDQQTQTATEIMTDMKPEVDRLQVISEMAEKRHKFIVDNVIKLNLSLPAYQGASVSYGRRYMIESPDELRDKYNESRAKGAAISVLDDLLTKYYEAEYSSDPVKLAVQTKLMKVEPFVHYKASEVEALQNVTAEDKATKTYFGEWLSQQNEAIILSYSVELLREQLTQFAAAKTETLLKEASDALALEAQYSYRSNAA